MQADLFCYCKRFNTLKYSDDDGLKIIIAPVAAAMGN